jgi:hypothetical protein
MCCEYASTKCASQFASQCKAESGIFQICHDPLQEVWAMFTRHHFQILKNMPNKLEIFSLARLSSLVQSIALANWAHRLVTKKRKCCEYSPFTLFF